MRRLALVVMVLCSCAGPKPGLMNSGDARAGEGAICDQPINCGGGSADPLEVGLGVAIITGIVFASLWRR